MNQAAWREAWRWQREEAAVPWLNRVGLGLLMTALFLLAGWAERGTLWMAMGFAGSFWGVVGAGIAQDVRSAAARIRGTRR